jgi:hypothetical protein
MPEYATVYEISGQSSIWPFARLGLIPLVAGGVMIFGKSRFQWRQPGWFLACSWCLFGLGWLAIVGDGLLRQESGAINVFRKGDSSVVEGVVTDFHPMPYA